MTSSVLMQQAKEQLSGLKDEAQDTLESQLGSKLNMDDEQVDRVRGLFKEPGK